MRGKKLVCLALSMGVFATMLAGCSSGATITSSSTDKVKIEKALEELKNMGTMYQISNVMQAPDGDLCYVEIVDDGVSYTEYPVDEDGNYGTIAFQDSNNTDYVLMDWLTKDGKAYTLSSEDKWVSYPDTYSKQLQSRNLMYADKIIDKLTDIKFKETITTDIGMGDESIDLYTGKLDNETVRSILGMSSEQLYKSINSTTSDKNIKKLTEYYLDDIGFSMVFSDANVTLGVSDGVLRYLQIETGGLGSRLYYTKAILMKDLDERSKPDFSKVDTFESTMKETADFVGQYDSYEEAVDALSELDNTKDSGKEKSDTDSSSDNEDDNSDTETDKQQ